MTSDNQSEKDFGAPQAVNIKIEKKLLETIQKSAIMIGWQLVRNNPNINLEEDNVEAELARLDTVRQINIAFDRINEKEKFPFGRLPDNAILKIAIPLINQVLGDKTSLHTSELKDDQLENYAKPVPKNHSIFTVTMEEMKDPHPFSPVTFNKYFIKVGHGLIKPKEILEITLPIIMTNSPEKEFQLESAINSNTKNRRHTIGTLRRYLNNVVKTGLKKLSLDLATVNNLENELFFSESHDSMTDLKKLIDIAARFYQLCAGEE
jgi:hypothetical protein